MTLNCRGGVAAWTPVASTAKATQPNAGIRRPQDRIALIRLMPVSPCVCCPRSQSPTSTCATSNCQDIEVRMGADPIRRNVACLGGAGTPSDRDLLLHRTRAPYRLPTPSILVNNRGPEVHQYTRRVSDWTCLAVWRIRYIRAVPYWDSNARFSACQHQKPVGCAPLGSSPRFILNLLL